MKKYLKIALLLFVILGLSSCFGNDDTGDSIEDIKNDLLSDTGGISDDVPTYIDENASGSLSGTGSDNPNNSGSLNNSNNSNNSSNSGSKNTSSDYYSINYLGNENYIEIDNLDSEDFAGRKVEITGKTLTNVDKIIVSFSNSSSNFPNDRFQLSQFKSGDSTFLYRAYAQYSVLDYGVNKYIIEAYSGDNMSSVEVTIDIPRDSSSNSTNGQNDITNDTLNNEEIPFEVITDTDINNLELGEIESNLDLTDSDILSSLLGNGWYYWNSLGKNGNLISYYVIRLEGDEYVYEKQYYLTDGTYGVLELERGTGINSGNIQDANDSIEERNNEFDTSIADEYFNNLNK